SGGTDPGAPPGGLSGRARLDGARDDDAQGRLPSPADLAKPRRDNHDVYFVPGLARGLRALEAVGEAGRPMTITEIGRALDLSRSSAFRLVYTLTHMKFLEAQEDGRRYALGPRVLNLGFAWLAGQDLVQAARPELERLAAETGVAAHLAIRDARDVLYLDAAQPPSGGLEYVSNVKTGARRPAHASPMGWLLLCELSPLALSALYVDVAMPAFTEHTPTDLNALNVRAAGAGARGHVISRGLLAPGGASVCVPVRGRDGMIAGAIDVSAPEAAFRRGPLETAYLPALTAAAARISARLGHDPDRAAGHAG
ncbi:MAG: IclR family transcriptional regulator, partial [Pseudomonadota bacterium]